MRRRTILAVLIVLALTGRAWAVPHPAIGKIEDGATVFCVSKNGILLTAKHCVRGENEVVVYLNGRRYEARVFLISSESGGPALLKISGSDHMALRIAPEAPAVGTPVYTIGYPDLPDQHTNTGRIAGADTVLDGVPVYVADMKVMPGMSGCPLLDVQGRVVGLLYGKEGNKSFWWRWEDIQHVCRAIEPTDIGLKVGGLEIIGISGSRCRDRCPRSDDKSGGLPRYIGREEPPTPGPSPEAPDDPGSDAAAEGDWSAIKVVAVASVGTPQALRLAVGPGRRILSEISKGKAALDVVAERVQPNRYAAVTAASGMTPEPLGLLVLVKKQNVGIAKGFIAGQIEKYVRPALAQFDKVPIEVIFEREHGADFAAIETALLTFDEGYVRGEQPAVGAILNDDKVKEIVKNAIGDKLAALEEKIGNPPVDDPETPEDESEDFPWWYGLLAAPLAAVRRWLDGDPAEEDVEVADEAPAPVVATESINGADTL